MWKDLQNAWHVSPIHKLTFCEISARTFDVFGHSSTTSQRSGWKVFAKQPYQYWGFSGQFSCSYFSWYIYITAFPEYVLCNIAIYVDTTLHSLLQLISISLTLDFARSTAIKPGLVQCWISSTNRSAVVSPLTYDVNCFKSTILDNIFGIKQRNQATLDCSRKLRYLLLQNIWSLLQRFYFRKEDWTLRAISTQFCHFPQYFLILFLSLKSFGTSWGNVVYSRFFFFTFYLFFYTRMFFTFNINHCFPCGELKLFWNVAKLQNITSMIIWEFLICSLHFE